MNIFSICVFEYLEPWLDLNWSHSPVEASAFISLSFLCSCGLTCPHQGHPLCYCSPLILSYSTWVNLSLGSAHGLPTHSQAFRYVSTEMAHNLYFIRPWYNWWQWGKVMPSGPSHWFSRHNPQTGALKSKMWIRHEEADEAVSLVSLVLRGAKPPSVPERSNYSACMYFENMRGPWFIQHPGTFWSEFLKATIVVSHGADLVSGSWK